MAQNVTPRASDSARRSSSTLLYIIIIALLILGAIAFFSRNRSASNRAPAGNSPTQMQSGNTSNSQAPSYSGTGGQAPGQQNNSTGDTTDNTPVKTFSISAKPFEFSMKEIRVKKGDKVVINFSSQEGIHSWGIDEFNVRTKPVQPGQTDTVAFVADKTGTFQYYCNIDSHRDMGMVGNLIVE